MSPMGERPMQELSSDPGELVRVYQEYLDSLVTELALLLAGEAA